MVDNIQKCLELLDDCKLDTKIILVIILALLLIGAYFLMKGMGSILKQSFNFSSLVDSINKLARIIKDYELKTIAGLINFTMSLLLLIVTIGVFLSISVASFLGFTENITAIRILFVLLTAIASFASIWVLYKFEKITDLISR